MRETPLPWKVVDDHKLTGYFFSVPVDANDRVVFAAHMWDHDNTLKFIVDAVNSKGNSEGVVDSMQKWMVDPIPKMKFI